MTSNVFKNMSYRYWPAYSSILSFFSPSYMICDLFYKMTSVNVLHYSSPKLLLT